MNRATVSLALALAGAVGVAACGKKEAPPIVEKVAEVACTYSPSQSAVVSHLASLAGGSATAAAGVAKAAGLTAVLHSSGAYIFTGPAGYLAGTLGTAITLPAVVAVGAAVGGSAATLELLCAPRNHPEYYAQVEGAAIEFAGRYRELPAKTVEAAGDFIAEVKRGIIKVGNDALEYAKRKSVDVSDAVRQLTQ